MRSHDLPFVDPKMVMSEVVAVMTEGRLGLALVGAADDLRGIITDGDLRRTLVEGHNLSSLTAEQVMNPTPQTISANASYGQAEEMMLEAKIQALVVLSDDRSSKASSRFSEHSKALRCLICPTCCLTLTIFFLKS